MTEARWDLIRRSGVRHSVVLGAAIILGGCSFASDTLFGDGAGPAAEPPPPPPAAVEAAEAPEEPGFFSRLFPFFGDEEDDDSATMSPGAPGAPQMSSSGSIVRAPAAPTPTAYQGTTVVGQRVNQFRGEYEALRGAVGVRNQQSDNLRAQAITNANAYNATVGAIRSRLQIGTTPGNPELLAQWQYAQEQLSASEGDLLALNQLSAQVSTDAGTAGYLLDNVRAAYTLSGAVDEDHRQLRVLEDDLSQTNIGMDRLLQSLNRDISRQQQFVAGERSSLVDLAGGINSGQLYLGATARTPTASAPQAARQSSPTFADRRPLVVIRFDKANVQYEPALYQALSRAMERRPDSIFDVVAVSASGASPAAARRNADAVMRSMATMGLPAERTALATMTSPTASSPEVHVYVR